MHIPTVALLTEWRHWVDWWSVCNKDDKKRTYRKGYVRLDYMPENILGIKKNVAGDRHSAVSH
jgi:hypothetical protein